MRRLTAAMATLAGNEQVGSSGGDEISVLSESFSRMEESLRDKQESLAWNSSRLEVLHRLETALLHRSRDSDWAGLVVQAFAAIEIDVASHYVSANRKGRHESCRSPDASRARRKE